MLPDSNARLIREQSRDIARKALLADAKAERKAGQINDALA